MNNLLTRTLSGAVFVILILGSILLHPLVFAGFMLLVALLGLNEFYRITSADAGPLRFTGLSVAAYLFLSVALDAHHILEPFNEFLLLLNIPLLGLPLILQVFRPGEKPFTRAALTIGGTLYVSLPLALLNYLYYPGLINDQPNPWLLISIFALTWVNDTFAYLTGSLIGKHALCPAISPKKTWEGSLGGAVFSLSGGFLLSAWFPVLSLPGWMALAILIVIAGTLGDLTESMLKRSYNLKDSGNIMPGHGGVLDRFDAMLGVAPAAFTLLFLIWST